MIYQPLFCPEVQSYPGLVALRIQFHHDLFNIKIILTSLFPGNHEAETLYVLECYTLDFLKPRILMP